MNLIQPKPVTITTMAGEQREYILSKFPAIAGREIIVKYPLSSMPKLGDYAISEETMLKLMAFVAVPLENGGQLALTTKALVNNHVPDWETLAKIEVEMLEYNTSFFSIGKISKGLKGFEGTLQASVTRILTDLLARSSAAKKPPSES